MNIDDYLKINGIKKAHLAKMLGVPRQNINKLLVNPREETARKIADALEVPLWMLYFIADKETLYCPYCNKVILGSKDCPR